MVDSNISTNINSNNISDKLNRKKSVNTKRKKSEVRRKMSEINNLFEEELSEEEDEDDDYSIKHKNEEEHNSNSPTHSNDYGDVPQFDRYEFSSDI